MERSLTEILYELERMGFPLYVWYCEYKCLWHYKWTALHGATAEKHLVITDYTTDEVFNIYTVTCGSLRGAGYIVD